MGTCRSLGWALFSSGRSDSFIPLIVPWPGRYVAMYSVAAPPSVTGTKWPLTVLACQLHAPVTRSVAASIAAVEPAAARRSCRRQMSAPATTGTTSDASRRSARTRQANPKASPATAKRAGPPRCQAQTSRASATVIASAPSGSLTSTLLASISGG